MFTTSFDLYVSSKHILHCREIALLLKKQGIISNVTQNDTIIQNGNKFNLEIGCKITGSVKDPRSIYTKIWPPLQHTFKLKCAYLHLYQSTSGCIFDIFRESSCPSPEY